MRARKLSLDNEKLFEKKKRKYVLIFVFWKHDFETKMTNLVSDLFILLSVHPLWGKDVVG